MICDMKRHDRTSRLVRGPPTLRAPPARAHLTVLDGLPPILESFGVACEPILKTAKLSLEDLADPTRSAPFEELDRLVGLCVRETGCAHLGLLLGQHVNMQTFGVAGRVARNAPSVGAALNDLAAYFVLHDNGGSIAVSIHEGSVTLSYGVHVTGLRSGDQIYDMAVAAMVCVMRQLCGSAWRPEAVMLPRRRPTNIRPYRDHFLAPLRFDSILAAIVFPERCLNQPIVDADPLLRTLLAENASNAIARRDPVMHGDVRKTIRLLLLTRQCSRAEVARRLGLHERALGRRLQASGTTFQRLLDDTREEIARQLLCDTDIPAARVATALGYSDATVFTRAFTRWTGQTPSEFRAQLLR
jgi:AraC-like DNA-binding protein